MSKEQEAKDALLDILAQYDYEKHHETYDFILLVLAYVNEFDLIGIDAIRSALFSNTEGHEYALIEVLSALGEIQQDENPIVYQSCFELAIDCLKLPATRIRYGAMTTLSLMNDKSARPYLEAQLEVETSDMLISMLKQIIHYLPREE